jgi:HD-GYP domain-containing protein (c-di-GMP phosphodiesterase class II)
VIAVVDAFDAILHARPYRPARSFDDAISEIARGAGSQFDPALAAIFVTAQRDEELELGVP